MVIRDIQDHNSMEINLGGYQIKSLDPRPGLSVNTKHIFGWSKNLYPIL